MCVILKVCALFGWIFVGNVKDMVRCPQFNMFCILSNFVFGWYNVSQLVPTVAWLFLFIITHTLSFRYLSFTSLLCCFPYILVCGVSFFTSRHRAFCTRYQDGSILGEVTRFEGRVAFLSRNTFARQKWINAAAWFSMTTINWKTFNLVASIWWLQFCSLFLLGNVTMYNTFGSICKLLMPLPVGWCHFWAISHLFKQHQNRPFLLAKNI